MNTHQKDGYLPPNICVSGLATSYVVCQSPEGLVSDNPFSDGVTEEVW